MGKVSIRRVQQRAIAENRRVMRDAQKTTDSFQNFALGLGIGTNNLTSANTYGFNPKTRIRTELEWAYRGSFVAGVAIDVIADDMTREGVDLIGDLEPDQVDKIHERATTLAIWPKLNALIKWSRLYGGAIAVLLIDGQDYSKPLRVDTVGPDQFKGLLVLDRWQVAPSLNDLVTEIGPHLGQPKFYTVEGSAPALRGMKIHYSRVLRLIGDDLPYQQAVAENLWGASVLERPFDRMSGFDAATTGASQQVHKSYLRYFKIDKYRDILGGLGGPQAYKGLQEMVASMRLFASNEGISLIDAKDEMVTTQATNFTGIADVLLQLGQQLSGTFQIPLVRLFGQSPAGLSATGESDLKTYYDGIKKRQVQDLLVMVTVIYRLIARSLRFKVGDGFGVEFRSLWQMDEPQKAEVAAKDTSTVMEAHGAGLISDRTALQELQHSARRTGRWKSITREVIEAASDEVSPPEPELPGPPGIPAEEDMNRLSKTADSDGPALATRNLHGMEMAIENPRGSLRKGDGWKVIMPYDYGYLPGVTGADGDSLDVAIGPNPQSPLVFVIDQNHLDGSGFDEHKVFFGYDSEMEAMAAFRRGHHRADDALMDSTAMTVKGFQNWLATADLSQPCSRIRNAEAA